MKQLDECGETKRRSFHRVTWQLNSECQRSFPAGGYRFPGVGFLAGCAGRWSGTKHRDVGRQSTTTVLDK